MEVRLYIGIYQNDAGGQDCIREFVVLAKWLMDYLDTENPDDLENFLSEYTSNESSEIYLWALLDGAIISDIVH